MGIEFLLIDSNAEMPTRRKQMTIEVEVIRHRERLSEETPRTGGAIVRTYGNKNRKKLAEMTNSSRELKSTLYL